jgi:mannose-6-phosphate isomerase-like protein (cupin superfamily)
MGVVGLTAQGGGVVDHALIRPADVKWGAAPASLPSGAQGAVLQGDPAKAGPFTLRLKLPDGYRIPPHYHPAIEHITVLQGTFVLGTGETAASGAETPLEAGSFAFMAAGMRHFVRARGETIVQLHGTGPWGITYVNASDDPRKRQD